MAKHNLTWDDVKKLSPAARRQVAEQLGEPPGAKRRPPSAPPAEPRRKPPEQRWREVGVNIEPGLRMPSTPRQPITRVEIEIDEPQMGSRPMNLFLLGVAVCVAPYIIWLLVALLHYAWTTS